MDRTRGYHAKLNKPVRERQIYIFTHLWNLRNLTEAHEGRERKKKKCYKPRGQPNHKRLLNSENKLRVGGGERKGKMGDGH